MATYAELRDVFSDATYRNKIQAAIVDAAQGVLLEADGTANHANRLKYAFHVLANAQSEAEKLAAAILLKNKSFTVSQITGASDAAALTEINAFYNEFADHFVSP